MNAFTFHSATFAIKRLFSLSKTKVRIHYDEPFPKGASIFVINHFTRLETIFLPYHLKNIVKVPVWSLADANLFKGGLGEFLNKAGALSTRNPDRDKVMVKSLLTGEYAWIIFPEGRMVKSKKTVENGEFLITSDEGKHKPHTGAATLALRTEFYRERIKRLLKTSPYEANRLLSLFNIQDVDSVLDCETFIIPVNITYYPIEPKVNALLSIVDRFVDGMTERMTEELMTEGSMLLSGVDVDIHFAKPININKYLDNSVIDRDLSTLDKINFDDPIDSKRIMKTSSKEIMNRYMTHIYNMTTINHDHILATLLKFIPFPRINEYDFKCRFYLAADIICSSGYFVHESLSENQISILTDDRYDKYKRFITIAEETGVVKIEDGYLIRDYTRYTENFDFHRIRIDNPVAVMANEIEPLRKIQSILLRLSLEPDFMIRRRMTSRLIEKLSKEYEKDYKTYKIEDESKGIDVGRPCLIEGDTRKIGVLLIHGYMAAPLELKALATFLSERGYWVYVPRLKGHGTSPEDLSNRSYMEWVEAVEEGYVILKSMCEKLIVGGFSTGAGLALDLTTRILDVEAVVAVAPPLKLHDFSSRFVPAVDTWNQFMKKIRINAAKKEFVENHPENPHINYFRNPIASIRELDRLMVSIESKLKEITIPALVMQARLDPVVDPIGSRRIFDGIGSEIKEYFLLNHNRHGILLGEGADRVHRIIGDFIDSIFETIESNDRKVIEKN